MGGRSLDLVRLMLLFAPPVELGELTGEGLRTSATPTTTVLIPQDAVRPLLRASDLPAELA